MQGSLGGVATWQGLFVVEKQSTTRLDGTGQSWNASSCATSLPEGILLGLVKVKSYAHVCWKTPGDTSLQIGKPGARVKV